MIAFATLCAALPHSKTALASYQAQASEQDYQAALTLLQGTRPRRIVAMPTLLQWIAEHTQTPDFLLAACLDATSDRAETAALLLPLGQGPIPSLSETLQTLAQTTPLTARSTLLALAHSLPPQARTILFRLAAGTFRQTLPTAAPLTNQPPRTLRAVLTLVQPAGPEITLALWDQGSLVPITRLPLTLPETPQIMKWVRAHTLARFGPVSQVEPGLVFDLQYASATPNRRRKCGLDLHDAQVIAWAPEATPDQADPLASLLTPD